VAAPRRPVLARRVVGAISAGKSHVYGNLPVAGRADDRSRWELGRAAAGSARIGGEHDLSGDRAFRELLLSRDGLV
jgi:hypothetical protein